jgi:hypothetical protein
MIQTFPPVVVYSTDMSAFMNNNILDRAFMAQHHHGEALTDMAEAIQCAGFEFMTIDRYLRTCPERKALLISDMAAGFCSKNRNIIPAICFSLESPIIASRYYHHIKAKTKSYAKVYDWVGTVSRIENATRRFLPISHPNTIREVLEPTVDWHSKKFLVVINSNKRAFQWSWPAFGLRTLPLLLRALVSNLRTVWIKLVDPIMKQELYFERLRAINYFSKYEDFDLYGYGWDSLSDSSDLPIKDAVLKCYRGKIPGVNDNKDKLEFLKRYKFSIVFENAVFPGYLTEKIFDCFFAGVIPVYLGDPNVSERIPSACFIDARDFKNYEALADYLLSMSEEEAASRLDAARVFIASSAFEPFTAKFFASTVVSCLNEIKQQFEYGW